MELLTRVDHVDIVFDSDLDDLIDGKIGLDRRVLAALANFVGLIRLWDFFESVSWGFRYGGRGGALWRCMLSRSS